MRISSLRLRVAHRRCLWRSLRRSRRRGGVRWCHTTLLFFFPSLKTLDLKLDEAIANGQVVRWHSPLDPGCLLVGVRLLIPPSLASLLQVRGAESALYWLRAVSFTPEKATNFPVRISAIPRAMGTYNSCGKCAELPRLILWAQQTTGELPCANILMQGTPKPHPDIRARRRCFLGRQRLGKDLRLPVWRAQEQRLLARTIFLTLLPCISKTSQFISR
jgi:hypothetical protein